MSSPQHHLIITVPTRYHLIRQSRDSNPNTAIHFPSRHFKTIPLFKEEKKSGQNNVKCRAEAAKIVSTSTYHIFKLKSLRQGKDARPENQQDARRST